MTDILALSNWNVSSVDHSDVLIIKAKYLVQPKFCLKCGSTSFYKHGPKPITYRDAPVRGVPVVIHAVLTRYRCRDCGGTFIQPVTGIEPDTRMTKRCVEYIQNYCLRDTFTNIAHHLGCDDKTVRTVANDYVARLNKAYKPDLSGWIGIDETMIDGKQRFVVVNVEQRRYIDMFDTRDKSAVSNWLQQNRNAPIEGFVMDMWKPYKDAIRAVFPNVPIVVDKFHVVRMANQAMEGVRVRLSKDRVKAIGRDWMRRKSLLRMRYNDLDEQGQYNVDMWLDNEPDIRIAHNLKELFYLIYEMPTKEDAAALLDEWLDTVPPEMKKTQKDFKPLVTAVKNWRQEILAYLDKQLTNGYTEAMNGVAKVINRQGRGYSFEMLRAKLLFKDNHREILKHSGGGYPGEFASVFSHDEIIKLLDSGFLDGLHTEE
nr:ISL3 family transposase [Acinetobacter nosocomialis]